MCNLRNSYLTIFVTRDCNLSCKYCYAEKGRLRESINIDFAKAGIDDFVKRHPASKEIRFFGGGEPTLRMDIIKNLVSYARKIVGSELKVGIQTNGAFSENTCEWIAGNLDEVWISCDGPHEIQDLQRPFKKGVGSHKVIERNIKYLVRAPIELGIRATITSYSNNLQPEIVDYFHSLGIKKICADHMFGAHTERNGLKKPQPMEYAKQFLKAKMQAEALGISYTSFLISNFDEPSSYNCRACIPYPHLTTDGYVTNCDFAYAKGIGFDDFIYGFFDKEKKKITYHPEKLEIFRKRKVENITGCQNCEIKFNCAGFCLGEIYDETGDIYGKIDRYCDAMKYLAKHLTLNTGYKEIRHP